MREDEEESVGMKSVFVVVVFGAFGFDGLSVRLENRNLLIGRSLGSKHLAKTLCPDWERAHNPISYFR